MRLRRWLLLLAPVLLSLSGCRHPAAPVTEKQSYYRADPNTAGSIVGRVLVTPGRTSTRRVEMDGDPQCAALHDQPVMDEEVVRTRFEGEERLGNVFVYIRSGLEGREFEPPTTPVVIEQRGCWFGPRVQGIMVGQTLEVINSDPVTHNIHPLAKVNREWNQSQAPGEAPLKRRFARPEVMIRIKCNIHHWMHAWVGAVGHPFFAVTGRDGAFSLEGVPPGTYTIEAWHEKLGRLEQSLVLPATGRSEMTFNFKGE